jgi:hypothetical protein
VLGVVNDPRLQDRVEAILVITGLGSTTLEETLSRLDVRKPRSEFAKPSLPDSFEAKPQISHEDDFSDEEMAVSSNDLDIPAFLRRGRRIAVKTMN